MGFSTRRTIAAVMVGAWIASVAAGVAVAENRTDDEKPPTIPITDVVQDATLLGTSPMGTLDVGSIEDLDLEAMRALILSAKPIDERADQETRTLTLEETLEVALTHNLDIHISRLGVEAGEDAVAEQRATFHPVLAAAGEADGFNLDRSGQRPDETRSEARALLFVQQDLPTGGEVRVGGGYQREATSKNSEDDVTVNFDNTRELAGLSIEVVQPLLAGGRVYVARSGILDAEYGEDINRAILSGAMLKVKALTKEAYYGVVRAARQVEVVERAIERDLELIDASQALYDAGRVSKVDVYSAEIGLANDQARLAVSRAEQSVQENELRRVLGLPVGVRIEAADQDIPFSPVRVDLTDWITRALRNRPELQQKRAEVSQARLQQRVANNAKLPQLDVRGTMQPGFDWASYAWEAGLAFSVPIGNKGPQARYRQSIAMTSVTQTELFRAQRSVELEVRELEIRLRESLGRITSLTHAVESARAKREIAAGRFELGLASNLDIVNADAELISAESQLLRAVADYASTVAFLEAAIGGPL